jgi:acetyltransferase-like isoleucine patch superfamily enzyme
MGSSASPNANHLDVFKKISYSNFKHNVHVTLSYKINKKYQEKVLKTGYDLLGYYDSIITHDEEIGNFVKLSPGCKLLGHTKIGNQVHVGAGAITLPRLIIAEGAIIEAGAVVTKHVEPYTTVLGSPAKVHKNENK